MDFSDNFHNVAELAFHGATEVDPEKTCRPEVIETMASWHRRADHQASGAELFHLSIRLFDRGNAGVVADPQNLVIVALRHTALQTSRPDGAGRPGYARW